MKALLLLLLLLGVGLERLYNFHMGGFTLSKVISSLPCSHPLGEETPEKIALIHSLLEQPFTFIGSGGTSFVFLGKDQKTILKLFKHQHLKYSHPLFRLTLPGWSDSLRIETILKKEEKHRHKRQPFFFSSCKIAYEQLKEETGLIYLSLTKNHPFSETLTLIDILGFHHLLTLNDTEFALQHFAEPLFPALDTLITSCQTEKAQEVIDQLLKIISTRCSQGIEDRDPNLLINFGLYQGKVVEYDIGSFSETTRYSTDASIRRELFLCTYELQKWLENRSPDLLAYLLNQLSDSKKETALQPL